VCVLVCVDYTAEELLSQMCLRKPGLNWCLIQSCVCSEGGFASLIPLHLFFFILAGFSDSHKPRFLSFSLPTCHLSLLSPYYQVVPLCSTFNVIAYGSLKISQPTSQTLQNQTLYGLCQICNLSIAICYKALYKLLVIFLHN